MMHYCFIIFLQLHFVCPFFRCRSAFKLLEMNEKHLFLKPGHIVIDCGAAPGSWTQVAVKKVNADESKPNLPVGKVIAIDKQQIYPIQVFVITLH